MKPNTIPADSLYKPMEEMYQERRINRSQSMFCLPNCFNRYFNFSVNAMPTDIYAKIVVTEVLKAEPRAWLWTGNQTLLVWFMDTFLGRRGFVSSAILTFSSENNMVDLQDWLMTKMFGFSEFSSMLKDGKVKTV